MGKSSVQKCSQKALGSKSECPPLEEGTLRLYSMRFCPYAQRIRCIIEHKGIPVEYVNINLTDKPEWFKTKNPTTLVPFLEWDNKRLYESEVIAAYLDGAYPTPILASKDPYTNARQRLIFTKFNKECVDSFNCFFRGTPEMKQTARPKLEAGMKWLDWKLGQLKTPFFSGRQDCIFSLILYYLLI